MRFPADMGVNMRVADSLRRRGHDVVHLREAGLGRLPDAEVFDKAVRERRTVLTFDLDFGEIAAYSGGKGVSIVVFRLRNTRAPHVLERLEAVLTDCAAALEAGAVVAVEESRHRVRRLPVGGTGADA